MQASQRDVGSARGLDPGLGKVPREEEMATHSSVFLGESRGQRSPAGHSPQGCKGIGHD